jgi:nicotinamidase-related amidase
MIADVSGAAPGAGGAGNGWRFYDGKNTLAPSVPLRADGSTALLVVDMQYHDASPEGGFNRAVSVTHPGSLESYERRVEEVVVPTIVRLLAYFRAHGMPVVFLTLVSEHRDYRDFPRVPREMTLELERRSGIEGILWAGDPGARILDQLAPETGELVIAKRSAGAFATSDIHAALLANGISELVVAGVTTSCCVESTAREAADRGYGVVIVADGCAEYDQAAHDATLRTFHGNFGRVVAGAYEIERAIGEGVAL